MRALLYGFAFLLHTVVCFAVRKLTAINNFWEHYSNEIDIVALVTQI